MSNFDKATRLLTEHIKVYVEDSNHSPHNYGEPEDPTEVAKGIAQELQEAGLLMPEPETFQNELHELHDLGDGEAKVWTVEKVYYHEQALEQALEDAREDAREARRAGRTVRIMRRWQEVIEES